MLPGSALVTAALLLGQPAPPVTPMVTVRGVSYTLGPPAAIGSQTAVALFPSPDGRFLAIVSGPPPAEPSATATDPEPDLAGLTLEVHSLAPRRKVISLGLGQRLSSWEFQWSSAPGRAFLRATSQSASGEFAHTVRLLSSASPQPIKTVVFPEAEVGADLRIFPSPTQPVALVFAQDVRFAADGSVALERWTIRRMTLEGEIAESLVAPRETSGAARGYWQGARLMLPVRKTSGAEAWAAIEAEPLSLAILPGAAFDPRAAAPLRTLDLRPSSDGLRLESAEGVGSILVTRSNEGFGRLLAPSFAAYIAEGQAFIREIRAQPADAVIRVLYSQARRRAERSARDIGQAVRFYWRDNNMRFPPKANLAGLLEPYLRWVESAAEFTPDFPGGRAELGVDTSATPLGWVQTPYGRAVVMLDGAVVWQEGVR